MPRQLLCPECGRRTPLDTALIKLLHAENYTYRQIGHMIGAAPSSVWRAMKSNFEGQEMPMTEAEDKAELLEIKKDMHAIQELMARLSDIVENQQKSIEGIKTKLEEMRRGNKG